MQADGTNARIVADSLDLQGAPAWAPDGQSITSAVDDRGTRTSSACRWTVALPRRWSRSTRSIPRGHPTAASLSTRDPTSARRFR